MGVQFFDEPVPTPPVAPAPQPIPAPVPTPAPVPVPIFEQADAKATKAVRVGLLIVVLLLIIGGYHLYYGWYTAQPDGLVAIGRAYRAELGSIYADAWESGAKILDAGQPVTMALDTTRQAWDAERLKAFDREVAPKFSRIIPEGSDEKTVTTEQRQALAKAWREFAEGLRQ